MISSELLFKVFGHVFHVVGRVSVAWDVGRYFDTRCEGFLEDVHFVEEEDDVRTREEGVGAYFFPEVYRVL